MTTLLPLALQHAVKRHGIHLWCLSQLNLFWRGHQMMSPEHGFSSINQGVWCLASSIPISNLGLRMDDNTVGVAMGLRLGSSLCHPHTCQHCGADVDQRATHDLSYRKSEGSHYCHSAINDILHRALSTARIPSKLKPSGLVRMDGKHLDGVTMIAWKNGRHLVWDVTCMPRHPCSVLPTPSYK